MAQDTRRATNEEQRKCLSVNLRALVHFTATGRLFCPLIGLHNKIKMKDCHQLETLLDEAI